MFWKSGLCLRNIKSEFVSGEISPGKAREQSTAQRDI